MSVVRLSPLDEGDGPFWSLLGIVTVLVVLLVESNKIAFGAEPDSDQHVWTESLLMRMCRQDKMNERER